MGPGMKSIMWQPEKSCLGWARCRVEHPLTTRVANLHNHVGYPNAGHVNAAADAVLLTEAGRGRVMAVELESDLGRSAGLVEEVASAVRQKAECALGWNK